MDRFAKRLPTNRTIYGSAQQVTFHFYKLHIHYYYIITHSFVNLSASVVLLQLMCNVCGRECFLSFNSSFHAFRVYCTEAPKLAIEACKKALAEWGGNPIDITHVIAISCTGGW